MRIRMGTMWEEMKSDRSLLRVLRYVLIGPALGGVLVAPSAVFGKFATICEKRFPVFVVPAFLACLVLRTMILKARTFGEVCVDELCLLMGLMVSVVGCGALYMGLLG